MNRKNTQCSIQKYLHIRPADTQAYEHLCRYHYRNPALGPHTHVFGVFDEHPGPRLTGAAVGIIIYRAAAANMAARNHATGGFFSGLPRAAGLALLNEHVRCISRVIIDPRYRGLGLASRLVRETMPQTQAALVEAVSVMGMDQPFFERAGMRRFRRITDVKTEQMKAALEIVRIDRSLWIDVEAVHQRLSILPAPQRQFIQRQMRTFLQKFASRRQMPHSLERTDFILSKLGDPGCYYLWQNPDKPVPGLRIAS